MIGTRDKTETPWGPRPKPRPKKGAYGPSLGVGPKGGKRGPHTGGPEQF